MQICMAWIVILSEPGVFRALEQLARHVCIYLHVQTELSDINFWHADSSRPCQCKFRGQGHRSELTVTGGKSTTVGMADANNIENQT